MTPFRHLVATFLVNKKEVNSKKLPDSTITSGTYKNLVEAQTTRMCEIIKFVKENEDNHGFTTVRHNRVKGKSISWKKRFLVAMKTHYLV